jgi:hypothetical protein
VYTKYCVTFFVSSHVLKFDETNFKTYVSIIVATAWFNNFKREFTLSNVLKVSSHLTENTLPLQYKDQVLKALKKDSNITDEKVLTRTKKECYC